MTRALKLVVLLCVLMVGLAAGEALAMISDPKGDFLPTYTAGAQGADLDVLLADVVLDPAASTLTFLATLDGPIGTTTGALYVFGLDRGQGTQRFLSGTPPIGAGIFFDSVLILRPNTTGQFNDLITPADSKALGSGTVVINGSQLSATLPLSDFPSKGFAADHYTWNLWPRLGVGSNNQISDFAPDASNALVSVVPEPSALLLIGSGLAGLGGFAWRRQRTN